MSEVFLCHSFGVDFVVRDTRENKMFNRAVSMTRVEYKYEPGACGADHVAEFQWHEFECKREREQDAVF
jgi:hypothetical protein